MHLTVTRAETARAPAGDVGVRVALRTTGMASCLVSGRPFGPSALRASGTKRSTCKFSGIIRRYAPICR